MPDSWLVAGSIAQTIWNLACGQPAELGLKDVDLIYFDDQDLSIDAEASHEGRLCDLFRRLPIKLDIKNEARVHLWYEERFGYAIKPYLSSSDAIATFPTTATAIGARRIRGKLECCAPFGLEDLFGLIVRPNKREITRPIYRGRRWSHLCDSAFSGDSCLSREPARGGQQRRRAGAAGTGSRRRRGKARRKSLSRDPIRSSSNPNRKGAAACAAGSGAPITSRTHLALAPGEQSPRSVRGVSDYPWSDSKTCQVCRIPRTEKDK